jgi:hypothetical protein
VNFRSAFSFLIISLLLTAITQAALAFDCKNVITDLDGSTFNCAESPVGFCSDGVITSGILKGTKLAVYQGLAPHAGMPGVEPENVFSYSGPATFSTRSGELWLDQVGVLDLGRGTFTELQRVTGGTGRFTGATGELFVSGTYINAIDWASHVTGFVCLVE